MIKLIVQKKTSEKAKKILQSMLRAIKLRTMISDVNKLTVDPLDGRIRTNPAESFAKRRRAATLYHTATRKSMTTSPGSSQSVEA